jgi:hypothetical protein
MAYTGLDTSNYAGNIFKLGKIRAPFLAKLLGIPVDMTNWNIMTAISAGKVRIVNSNLFTVAQTSSITAPAQTRVVAEDDSRTPTPTTYTRGQDTNAVQVHQQVAEVPDIKESNYGQRAGLNVNEPIQPVSELDFQVQSNMTQIAVDLNYSCLNGSYQAAAASTAGKTRGLANAISTNNVAAASADLEKAMINEILRTMQLAGAPLMDIVCVCSGIQIERMNDIYGYPVQSNSQGGYNIQRISTPYGDFTLINDYNTPTDSVFFTEMSDLKIVIQPLPSGLAVVEPLARTGASNKIQILLQAGLDYGPEEHHGSITGLSTS